MIDINRVGGRSTCFLLFAVERPHSVRSEIAVDTDVAFRLERFHRIAHRIVIKRVVFVARNVEALAQRGHARVFHARTEDLAIRHMDARVLRLFSVLVSDGAGPLRRSASFALSALNSACGGL